MKNGPIPAYRKIKEGDIVIATTGIHKKPEGYYVVTEIDWGRVRLENEPLREEKRAMIVPIEWVKRTPFSNFKLKSDPHYCGCMCEKCVKNDWNGN